MPFASDNQKHRALAAAGVPPRFFNVDPSAIPLIYADLTSAFLTGPPGVGKTLLMCALVARDKAARGGMARHVQFVPACDLLFDIRDTYNRSDRSEREVLDKFSMADTLYLDDLGADRATDWSLQVLYQLLNTRYNHNRTLVVSSNKTLVDLKAAYGARLVRRIQDMCPVVELKKPVRL